MSEQEQLLWRIGKARELLANRPQQPYMNYVIDGVLADCAEALKELYKDPVIICENCGHRIK